MAEQERLARERAEAKIQKEIDVMIQECPEVDFDGFVITDIDVITQEDNDSVQQTNGAPSLD